MSVAVAIDKIGTQTLLSHHLLGAERRPLAAEIPILSANRWSGFSFCNGMSRLKLLI
jgi:hypothetical protein